MKTNSNNQSSGGLKLNYKRTFIIGFAFFGILLLWQVYDSWCPTMLTELFKEAFNTTNERDVQYLDLPSRRCTPLPTTASLNILLSPLSWRVLIVQGISMECARW